MDEAFYSFLLIRTESTGYSNCSYLSGTSGIAVPWSGVWEIELLLRFVLFGMFGFLLDYIRADIQHPVKRNFFVLVQERKRGSL